MAGARPKNPVIVQKPGLLDVTTVDNGPVNPIQQVKSSGGNGPSQATVQQPVRPGVDPLTASIAAGHPLTNGTGQHPGVDILGNPLPTGSTRPVLARNALGVPIAAQDAGYTPLDVADINTARNAAVSVRGAQGRLTPELQAAAAGAVPSAAQIASRAQLNAQSLAMARAAAAVRGGAPAMLAAQHAGAVGLGGVQGAVISQGGAAREAELQRAQQVLAQHLLTTRGGDLAVAGNDINTATANANIKQGSQVANQGNALRVGQANLTNEVNAGALDLNDATRLAIEKQQHEIAMHEALDSRAIGLAGVGLGGIQNDANAVNAGNAEYLGTEGLKTQGQGLQYEQKAANAGIDAGFLAAVLGGAAALPALASIPGAPSGAPTAAPAAPASMAPAYTPTPTYQPTSIATPALTLAPLPTPQNMYAQYGLGGY